MRLKTVAVAVLVVALFPALVTGVAQQALRALLQEILVLLGGSHG